MKRIKLFVVLSLIGLVLFSCSKQQEETKMLPATAVKKSGTHSDLLEIKDSVKVMLVKISDDRWSLRALIPIENAQAWETVTRFNTPSDPEKEYFPSMGHESMFNDHLSVEFLDANGSPIDFKVDPDWDVVNSVLASNSVKKEDMLVKESYDINADEYKIIKEKFDKIAGIAIKKMDLHTTSKNSGSSYASGSSYSSGDDDWDDVDLDDAVNAAKAATEVLKATGEVMKSSTDMYKSAKKAEKELKKLEEDDDWGW